MLDRYYKTLAQRPQPKLQLTPVSLVSTQVGLNRLGTNTTSATGFPGSSIDRPKLPSQVKSPDFRHEINGYSIAQFFFGTTHPRRHEVFFVSLASSPPINISLQHANTSEQSIPSSSPFIEYFQDSN